MAEDSDLERTEPASQRRLDEARARGQIPRSPELATFSVLLAGGGAMMVLGAGLVEVLGRVVARGLTLDRAEAFRPELMVARLREAGEFALVSFGPYLLVLVVVALVAPLLVSGWIFTFEAVAPQFSRLDPAKGLGRMFSTRGLIELGKAIGKALVVGGVATLVLKSEIEPILGLSAESYESALAHLGHLLLLTFLTVVGAMALLVAIDVPFQLWQHAKQLRMTKEEVRREHKETEGDPQVKGRIRQMQREQARRRMMAEVPRADVVVTNPTHFAVALRYRESSMRAPIVVAKGSSLVAERIIALAEANRVPVLRAPPLARALHAHADLGREIPGSLYTAVAEVLAYVFQLSRFEQEGGAMPAVPADIRVPPELDPDLATEEP
ncbi:MAG: flagellar type III secretion system protein FlhB [Betaproteobacteria bacterium]|nr:flagellar type III secretion system protein FlhB [Betaproteobacteria bacterium]